MRRFSLYLDTSVINFLFADDAPGKMAITQELFDRYIKIGIYSAYVSPVVYTEIRRTPDPMHRKRLVDAIDEYDIKTLDLDLYREQIVELADEYLASGTIPTGNTEDALHVAVATYFEMDILLSWNFKHMANVSRESRVQAVNMRLGYLKPLRILTPMGVLDENA